MPLDFGASRAARRRGVLELSRRGVLEPFIRRVPALLRGESTMSLDFGATLAARRRGVLELLRREVLEPLRRGVLEPLPLGVLELLRRGVLEPLRRGVPALLRGESSVPLNLAASRTADGGVSAGDELRSDFKNQRKTKRDRILKPTKKKKKLWEVRCPNVLTAHLCFFCLKIRSLIEEFASAEYRGFQANFKLFGVDKPELSNYSICK